MEKKFIRVDEVARVLEISESHAYKLMRKLNRELEAKGYITVAGRVNRQYFNERFYGAERSEENSVIDCDQIFRPKRRRSSRTLLSISTHSALGLPVLRS